MGTKLNATAASFEDALKELEDILGELEDSKVPLSDLVERYTRAQECLKICRSKLEDAEMKVKKLSSNGIEDFEPEA